MLDMFKGRQQPKGTGAAGEAKSDHKP